MVSTNEFICLKNELFSVDESITPEWLQIHSERHDRIFGESIGVPRPIATFVREIVYETKEACTLLDIFKFIMGSSEKTIHLWQKKKTKLKKKSSFAFRLWYALTDVKSNLRIQLYRARKLNGFKPLCRQKRGSVCVFRDRATLVGLLKTPH